MSTRAERRDATEAAILAAGLKLLSEQGAEALTVRGLARELSLVPSALYRYVKSREDLLEILVGHAFADWADTVEAAHDAVPAADLVGRWRAFAHALRNWALANPHMWRLVQGQPVSGFGAALARSYARATRLHLLLARLGADMEAAGVRPNLAPGLPPSMPGLPMLLAASGVQVSEPTALAGMASWHLLAGAIYAEQFGQAGIELVDPDLHYEAMVSATERLLFGSPEA